MDWLKTMYAEHGVIMGAANSMGLYSARVAAGKEVPQETADGLLEIVKDFADACHHAKEERALFPLLREKAARESALVDTLLAEHEEGRRYVHDIAMDGRDAVVRNAAAYGALLRLHIAKENRFFAECDKLLGSGEKAQLAEGFEEVEAGSIGLGKRDEYLKKAGEVARVLKSL